MKIRELTLYTNQLEKQKDFFLNVLGFELFDENVIEICFKIGESKLKFCSSENIHFYHYCFLLPSNKLLESLAWMNKRTETIDVEKGEKIVHFDDWNADSFYFYDGGGNIAEFIVLYELKNEVDSAFDLKMVLGINEIGIGTEDIVKINSQLEKKIGSMFYKGNYTRFGTNGSAEGIFLIPNYQLKETWFPTDIKIKAEPFEAIIENESAVFKVVYKNALLEITPI